MSLITSISHAFAIAAQDIVKAGRIITTTVLPTLQRAQADAPVIEAVTGLVSPQAANIERSAFAVLGLVIKAIDDAATAANAGGVNISLDASVVSDIRAIMSAVKAVAPPVSA